MTRLPIVAIGLGSVLAACGVERPHDAPAPDTEEIGETQLGLSGAARRPRSEAIRDVAAGEGLTNGALLAGIAQVETGLSHCWSEATWACQGLDSPSCGGGPVIAGAADGPCSAQQGGLGMFQFDGGTYAQTIARDGEEILLLEGNIAYAVEFVAERVRQDIPGVDSIPAAIEWINAVPVQAGDPVFEQWIELVSCRYNGCCGCSSQEAKYRDATLAALVEFEPGFWDIGGETPPCELIGADGAVLEETDPCAVAGGNPAYWRTEAAGHGGALKWTHATDSANTENFGQWNLAMAEAGRYRLEIASDGGLFGASEQAAYRVVHAGQETVVVIDQSSINGFIDLGVFELAQGVDQYVRFDDNTGEPLSTQTRIVFDALRVTRVTDADDDPDPIDDPDDPADDPRGDDDPVDPNGDLHAGCAAGGGSTSPTAALLLVAALVVIRRRRPK